MIHLPSVKIPFRARSLRMGTTLLLALFLLVEGATTLLAASYEKETSVSSTRSTRTSSSSSRSSSSSSSRSSRSSSSRDTKDSKTSAQQSQKPTASKPAATTTTRKTQPTKKVGQGKVIGGSKSKGRKSSGLSQFQMKADAGAAILYIDPPDQTVPIGKDFDTGFALSNPRAHAFNQIRVALRYDRDAVEPVSVADAGIRRFLAAPSNVEVRPRDGILIYTAQLAYPCGPVADTLFSIRWRTKRLTRSAEFRFVQVDEKPNGLWMNESDVLGAEDENGDGFIHGSAQIVTPDFYQLLLTNRSRVRPGEALEEEESELDQARAGLGGVKLALAGPAKPVHVGQQFQVDIVFDNSADSFVDGVEVRLQFDPNLLEVIDSDLDNWITRDVNILDGPYHDDFPFDFHAENKALNARGEIVYRVGIGDAEKLRQRVGTMASILFRAKAPSSQATVRFLVPSTPREPGTRITYLGKSALGRPEKGQRGLRDLTLKVVN